MIDTINVSGQLMSLDTPKVMGILNLTPDSFYADSRYAFCNVADSDIVDIGACSTRPDATPCTEQEELERLKMALPDIKKHLQGKIISIDTFRPKVAEWAIHNIGATIVNDISGGSEEMFELVSELHAAYILTYPYGESVDKMLYWFSKQIDALTDKGVCDIIIDPGFGFGKTQECNFNILHHFNVLKVLRLPILAGISRKSMIYKTLGITPEESLNGTTVLDTLLLDRGADILRVHDVKEAKEVIKLYNKTKCSHSA
ncbi:MAG: dihydropteroate synthase [Paludibacteraceae bacterium]|nr:dihydropteroate synthase [Paludibacteraceae bacterium]